MPLRIAIPLPISTDHAYNQLNWPAFAAAVSRHEAEPVKFQLHLSEQALAQLVRTCHGILLPGSPADVDPSRYGQPRDPSTAPADPARERTDLFLLAHAHTHHKPLLGICFGAQMLNVYRGGTLVQDLTVLPVNHACFRSVFTAHTVATAPASLLATMVSVEEAPQVEGFLRLPVNSSHHQAIAIPGAGLQVSGRCPQDAVIEAVEGAPGAKHHFVLGLQWHPERTDETSATSRAVFARLVQESAAWLDAQQQNGSRHSL